eukprot:COSAG02_NODE_10983_length_1819_cov_1.191860_2_plen_133_part_00
MYFQYNPALYYTYSKTRNTVAVVPTRHHHREHHASRGRWRPAVAMASRSLGLYGLRSALQQRSRPWRGRSTGLTVGLGLGVGVGAGVAGLDAVKAEPLPEGTGLSSICAHLSHPCAAILTCRSAAAQCCWWR